MDLKLEKHVGLAIWAPYLLNGDSSGLELDEIAAANVWYASLGVAVSVFDAGDSYSGHLNGVLADLVEYRILMAGKPAGHSLDRLPKSAFARGA